MKKLLWTDVSQNSNIMNMIMKKSTCFLRLCLTFQAESLISFVIQQRYRLKKIHFIGMILSSILDSHAEI